MVTKGVYIWGAFGSTLFNKNDNEIKNRVIVVVNEN